MFQRHYIQWLYQARSQPQFLFRGGGEQKLFYSYLLKKVVIGCILPTFVIRQTYNNFRDGCYALRLLALSCGTACQLVLGKQTSATNSLSGC